MKTRRDILKLAAAATVAGGVAKAEPIASRIIDTHTHFFDPTRPQGVPWPTKGSPLYRPVYPKDWLAVARNSGVHETVVVEASKLLEDNDWILNLAEREKCIVGFVGHLEPDASDFEEQLKRLAQNKLFRGTRINGDTLADNIESASFAKSMVLLASLDLALDINGANDLTLIAKLAEKVSALRIIIDHCGNTGDPTKLRPEWKPGIAACAKRKNIWCKVSALVEFDGPPYGQAPSSVEAYRPILDTLWDQFGADRLMYASNWPVSDKGGSYDVVFKIVSDYFQPKGPGACEKFFWKNSLAAYKWVERK